ncbi:hypothetical protein [Streptomyces sp. DT117]|uniref:hypothetical protein n=1 Tax=Streptomyces sp. DT117 TaxID=3393422 RepID=UPI003CEB9B3C
MHISLSGLALLIPAVGPICIALVAAIAIKANRKTTYDALRHQQAIEHEQFYRDKLTETYLALAQALERCSDSGYERELWKGTPKDLDARLLLFASILLKATLQAWQTSFTHHDVEELERLKGRIIALMREELSTGPGSLSITIATPPEARGTKLWRRATTELRLRKPLGPAASWAAKPK